MNKQNIVEEKVEDLRKIIVHYGAEEKEILEVCDYMRATLIHLITEKDKEIEEAEARGAKKVPVCQCGDFMVGHDTDGKHGDEYYCIGCDRKVYLQALTPTNETDFDSDEYGPDAFERQGGY